MPTLLLVEDNELNRDMLSRRLERRGYVVSVAVDASNILKVVREKRPDLVLLDMNLPEPDGWEATRRLKAEPATATVPIIALTAHALADDRLRAFAAGCDEFETKPVDLEALECKIQRLLAIRPA